MDLDDLTLIKRKRKNMPKWIIDNKEAILSLAKDKAYNYSYSYGDAKYDLKEHSRSIKASDYCNNLQLVRYEWYDRYGAPYGKSIEDAQYWFEERDLPAPEEYLDELLSKTYSENYREVLNNLNNNYENIITIKLKYPPRDAYFIIRKFFIWSLYVICFISPYSIYLALRGIFFNSKASSISIVDISYSFIALISNVVLYLVVKDFDRGRLRIRKAKHMYTVIFVPLLFYIVISIILLKYF